MSDDLKGADFDTILRQTQMRIRAYIAGMGIAPHEVDDVAQDVYVELFRNFEKVPTDVPIDRWIKGIARNLCLNHIRKISRRGRLHREALVEILSNTDTQIEKTGDQKSMEYALDGCCDKLPEKSRKILLLRYTEEMPSAQIAEKMSSTAEAIRVALHRIRAQLKDCITHNLSKPS